MSPAVAGTGPGGGPRSGADLGPVGDPEALLALAEGVAARARPGEQVEVVVGRSTRNGVKVHAREVESYTSASTSSIGVRVVTDRRVGFAHAGSLDADVLDGVLADARDNTRFAEPDEWAGLAEPDSVVPVPQELWHDEVLATTPEHRIAAALDLEDRVRALDPRVTGVRAASYGDGWTEVAVASTTGVRSAWRATSVGMGVSALAEDGDETRTGAGSDAARHPDQLDPGRAAADAVDRAVRLFGAGPVPSQRVAMLLEPRMAATVFGLVGGMLSGSRLVKGRTPFAGREGEQVAAPCVSLVDDPTDEASLGAATFDGEGLACRRNALVTEGVLDGFVHNAYTARRVGTTSTGSAVRGIRSTPGVGIHALAAAPGSASFDELRGGIDLGILVYSLTGLHSGVNLVSGDFSVGAEGLLIRDGELAEPVRGVTLASSLQRMLLDVRAVGRDLERLPGGSTMPAVVIDGVALSGS